VAALAETQFVVVLAGAAALSAGAVVLAGAVVVVFAGAAVFSAGGLPPQAASVRARATAAGASMNLDMMSPCEFLFRRFVQAIVS
jgi:hypothetical protein